MVKFKVGFTITPEVLFGIISKVLPLEDLHIEQVVETPAATSFLSQAGAAIDRARLNTPKPKIKFAQPRARGKHAKRASHPMDLTKGVNKIIMDILKDGPCKATELRNPLINNNYSGNSVGSRLQNLEKNGVVVRMGDGRWILSKSYKEMQKVVVDHHNGDEGE